MKGLLLKDFYMAMKYCRAFIIIIAVFLGFSLYGNYNIIFLAYPCTITSVIPVTLFSYDEHNKWTTYSLALPYTRKQLVSSKYIIGLIFGFFTYVLSIGVTTAKMLITNTFNLEELISLSVALIAMALVCPAIVLPFLFKLGSDKGRIVFYGMCCIIAALMAISPKILTNNMQQFGSVNSSVLFAIIGVVVTILLYGGSWLLSISFFEKREF